MKKHDAHQTGGRGAEEPSLIRTGPALPSASRPENDREEWVDDFLAISEAFRPTPPHEKGEGEIPPQQPGGSTIREADEQTGSISVVVPGRHTRRGDIRPSGAHPVGPFSDSEGGRESASVKSGAPAVTAEVKAATVSAAAFPALYTVPMSYISLIVKLGEMDAITFREIEKQVMKDQRLTDWERKTCIIPLLDARWRYLAAEVEARR